MNILFAIASVFYILKDNTLGKYVYLAILLLIVWIVLRTSIISDKKIFKTEKEKAEKTDQSNKE